MHKLFFKTLLNEEIFNYTRSPIVVLDFKPLQFSRIKYISYF